MKNILIKIDTKKTITVKDYLLNIFSQKMFNKNYENCKSEINDFIRTKVKSNNLNSMETTKFIIEYISSNDTNLQELQMKIERLQNQNIELENSYLMLQKKLKIL